ncbi:unnamed protein product [Rotaria magnacalcarata]|uniref:Uncharacterized protein n=1 Tax=Rotaria magnacalcarata TaxID=392030 RepID=A0A820AXW5_9BILA|nr:unnamed protein product [Rotaria magnacalcarata]
MTDDVTVLHLEEEIAATGRAPWQTDILKSGIQYGSLGIFSTGLPKASFSAMIISLFELRLSIREVTYKLDICEKEVLVLY